MGRSLANLRCSAMRPRHEAAGRWTFVDEDSFDVQPVDVDPLRILGIRDDCLERLRKDGSRLFGNSLQDP
jgi:hypothetical protein